jgi:Tol biopolymer transport system component
LSALGSAAVVSAWFLLRLPADAIPEAADPVAFTVSPPAGLEFVGTPGSVSVPQLAVSPDGRHLVFVAAGPRGRAALWLRTLTEPEPHELIGTEGAEVPFWAPDSRSIGFFSEGVVKRKDITNRAPAEVVTKASVDVRGSAWGEGGTIVFSPTGTQGLRSVPADGSRDATSLRFNAPVSSSASMSGASTAASSELFETARWPSFLPGGQQLLFMIRHQSPSQKGVYVGSRDGGAAYRVVDSDFGAQYSAGHLLALNGSTLVAHPVDLRTGRTSGAAVPIAQPVAGSSTGYPAFSASATGVLAYSAGLLAATELWRFDRAGRAVARLAPAAVYPDFAFSPDGRRLAFSRTAEQLQAPDIWVLDLDRGAESRLSSDPLTETTPLWSPSGDRILFRANRESANLTLWQMAPNPGAVPDSIFSADEQRRAHGGFVHNVFSTDWSADGRWVVYHRPDGEGGGYDIWALSLEGERRSMPVTRGRSNEIQAEVSPDSRWVAYSSDESGRYEIYVQPFPDAAAGAKTTISVGGGLQPRWSADGRELYYLRSDSTLMAVAVRTDGSRLSAGASTSLFKTNLPTAMNAYRSDYAVAPDGKGFVMKVAAEGTRPPTITVILNWPALLKKPPTS